MDDDVLGCGEGRLGEWRTGPRQRAPPWDRKERLMRMNRRMAAAMLSGLLVLSQGTIAFASEDMGAGGGTDALVAETEQLGAETEAAMPKADEEAGQEGVAEGFGAGVGLDLSTMIPGNEESGAESEISGDTCVLDDIQLTLIIPDNSILQNAEDEYMYYLYTWGSEGIPDIIIGAFDYSDSFDTFADRYTEYMSSAREDLSIAEPQSDVTIGDKALKKIVYNYTISGHTIQDTRYFWSVGPVVYMFAKREIPAMDYTLGNTLEDVIAGAQSMLDDPAGTTAQTDAAPQPDTTAQTDAAPQPDTTAQTDAAPAWQTGSNVSYEPSDECVQNEDKSWTVTTDYYTITIPAAWTGHFEASRLENTDGDGYALQVVNTESRDAGYGGELFAFVLIPEGEDYSFYPSYDYLGTMATPDKSYSVIVRYPTDLQTGDMWQEFYNILNGDKNRALTSVRPKAGVVWTLPDGSTVDGGQASGDTAQTDKMTETPQPETTDSGASGNLIGVHNGNTYTNKVFGFSYTVPSGWVMATDNELVTLNGGVTMEELPAKIEAGNVMYTSYAYSQDGMNVMLVVEYNVEEYLDPGYELTQEDMNVVLQGAQTTSSSALEELGAEVTGTSVNTVNFMGNTFYSLDVTFNYQGYSGVQKQVAIPAGTRMSMVTVRTVSGDNTQQMLDMFQPA